jgi:hypothetical protein
MKHVLMVSAAALMLGYVAPAMAGPYTPPAVPPEDTNGNIIAPTDITPYSTSHTTGFPTDTAELGNKSTIIQDTGNNNNAYVDQLSAGGNSNRSTVKQYGNNNSVGSAPSTQNGTPTYGVTQQGTTNTNISEIDQGVAGAGNGSDNNTATVFQGVLPASIGNVPGSTGNLNQSYISQRGSGYNAARTEQAGGSNISYSSVDQVGENTTTNLKNTVNTYQGTNGAVTPAYGTYGRYWSFAKQTGYNNTATIKQYGSYNLETSIVTQTGNGNVANVTQHGSGGDASSVIQSGGAQATIDQSGAGYNSSTVSQTGTSVATVTQDGTGGTNTSGVTQIGVETATVLQTSTTGATNSSTINQSGGTSGAQNVAYVHQH